jgi:hypothetical protein
LSIDTQIHKKFQDEKKKLPIYYKRYQDLQKCLTKSIKYYRIQSSIEQTCEALQVHIRNIESQSQLNFYIVDSADLLTEYKRIIETPIKLSFIGKYTNNNSKKHAIINEYLEIARKYIDIDIPLFSKKHKVSCNNCSNTKQFDIVDNNIYICLKCFSQQIIMKHISSYKDIDRVNISSKYTYDRRVHFRDCINQYQGKQNSTIEEDVYKKLEEQFDRHHLLGPVCQSKHKRFKNITKEHIMIFLKELDYTKHYENSNLIHYNLTGIKPDDIGYLEDILMDDFDILTSLYDKRFKHIDRKNFINTQYVLYQLLTRHKHPCKNEDFTVLKTIDRKSFHDNICKVLFEELNWNLNPLF